MHFRTYTDIPKSNFQIEDSQQMMMLGSCFSENIGEKMVENKFNVATNPFGILYNPLSISTAIRRLIRKEVFTEKDLVFHNDVYQSFLHHGKFSDSTQAACLNKISASFNHAATIIRKTNIFLITFGTAYVYKLKSSGEIVGNCHKFTSDCFVRERLTISEIVNDWTDIIDTLLSINADAKFIFTVSPIRHLKDGAHENQISKSILLLAIEQLQQKYRHSTEYFCAYEILLDDLRDYRFYAKDMLHPAETAIDYIWQKFSETYFSSSSKELLSEWTLLKKMLAHKPLNENSENHRLFLQQTAHKLSQFQDKYPQVSCEKEIISLNKKIKRLHP